LALGAVIAIAATCCVGSFFAQYFYFHPDDRPFFRPEPRPRAPRPRTPHAPHGDFPIP
jgi:hypothetical protein